MTIRQFLVRLKATTKQFTWIARGGGILRTANGEHCPISAVTGRKVDLYSPYRAGLRLGLTAADSKAIQQAADGWGGHGKLRTELRKAVGLYRPRRKVTR